ncbi:O-antigen ligase family protein [Paenibacillus eucommiae]|uniref:O-antigen ligase-related domain-containing protein n=1 Tax=Paenibacillus eucommiae TaxID=1355755 RepID=A0ABS4IU97_9BACL|nr:O-antigen ligase family protein [Paenibacillus eucommiae]MBP1991152.1 hypothetical protein [Paenibacillus eucommiae]
MVKKEKLDASALAEKSSLIYWLLISFVVMFLFWSPFKRALFNGNSYSFERSVYSSFIWSSIILLLVAVFFFYVWKWQTQRDALTVIVWLLPISYIISLITAVSHYYAMNMVYIQIMYACFFIVGIYLAKNKQGNSILSAALLTSGYVIVLFGMLNWIGNGKLAGSLVSWFVELENGVYRDAVMTDSNGLRLTAVFQYANSYAAYLIALLFASLFIIAKSRKWYIVGLNAFMLVPIIISFFLTLSRGAIVVIPVILLIILFFQKLNRQILYLVHMAVAFIASFLILQKLTDAGIQLHTQFSASVAGSNWLVLILVSLVVAGISILIQKFAAPYLESKLERFDGRKLTNFVVPFAAIILGIVGAILLFADTGASKLLPENIKTRIENINFAQHSVLERGTFYKDAVKVFKDYPIIGAGGGAWSELFEKYQNNPYISRQAHNFFLQYLVEVGLVGLLIFLAFLGLVFFLFIRSHIRNKSGTKDSTDSHFLFFIIAISLLVHSIIDFDLSFVYLGIILFLCLGAMVANSGNAPFRWNWNRPLINKGYPALLFALSITIFFISIRLLSANSSFMETLDVIQKSKDYNEITTPLNKALELHPNHPDYLMPTEFFPGKIGLLFQVYNQTKDDVYFDEAQKLLTDVAKKEKFNRRVLYQQITAYKLKNQLSEASDLVNKELVNFPWIISLYEESINLSFDLGSKALQEKDDNAREQHWNKSLEVYDSILAKKKILENLPKEQGQGEAFDISANTALSLAQIKYAYGDYAAASSFLQPFVQADKLSDPSNPELAQFNRNVARWYYAAGSKQNAPDQALYDKLLAADPGEQQQIELLLGSEPIK